ncbi:MAG: inner nuclear membrane protein enriched at telomere/subtelomere region [Trizodia sp. TS-e1964]|nr:MAG: inner nuclear membrane protein enriched at telomere/subtelomere region [Trizodia sp. TS-e1964]
MSSTPPDPELEYLAPGFDASSLTMPKLRGILMAHKVEYTSSLKKADLVDLFNTHLAPKAKRILSTRARIKRTSKGITDMPSSQEESEREDEDRKLMPPPPLPLTPRPNAKVGRKSRKSEAVDTVPDTSLPEQPLARAAGEGRVPSKHARESDTEPGAADEEPRPAARKTRKSGGATAIRLDERETDREVKEEGDVFSDQNPFQSGSPPPAEEARSSPSMQLLGKQRRSLGSSTPAGKDPLRRKSNESRRKTDAHARPKADPDIVVPSSSTFTTEIPLPARLLGRTLYDTDDEIEAGEEFTPEEQLELVRARAVNGKHSLLPPRRSKRSQSLGRISTSAPWIILLTLLGGYSAWWRQEKLQAGYCGIGHSSTMLKQVQIPDWASFLQPECEPCPQHAFCFPQLGTQCEENFLLTPHPLSLGGLVPLAPTCEPDGEKVRRIKAVADKALEELRHRRANWECGTLVDAQGIKEPTVEITETHLKEEVSRQRRKGMGDVEFEELWKGAIGEIQGKEEVIVIVEGLSYSGEISLTSTSLARLPFTCALRRSARLTLARYRIELALLISLSFLIVFLRHQISSYRTMQAAVTPLVSLTLSRLATQATLHRQGAASEPWVSVGQLRDDVLRHEFSAAKRERLWKLVRGVIEHNANVRASVRESRGGEVSRVWEWIGVLEASSRAGTPNAWNGSGSEMRQRTAGDDRRTSWGVDSAVGSSPIGPPHHKHALVNGAGTKEQSSWQEGRPLY